MPKAIREAIKIGYVEQALRLKKKLQRALKAMWLLSGILAVGLAVLLQLLNRKEASSRELKEEETEDLLQPVPQEKEKHPEEAE